MKKMLSYASYVIPALFVITYRVSSSWENAFTVGGCAALFHIVLSCKCRESIDSLLLGFELFLIGGLAMANLHIPFLANLYKRGMESTLFLSIVLVGIGLTLFSNHGFINSSHSLSRKTIIQRSLLLILFSFGTLIVSITFKGNIFYSAALPFIALRLCKSYLEKLSLRPFVKS